MLKHSDIHVLVVNTTAVETPLLWKRLGAEMEHVQISFYTELPESCTNFDTVITIGATYQHIDTQRLLGFVEAGGSWLVMPLLYDQPLPREFGVSPGEIGPRSDLRVLFHNAQHPLAERLPDAVYVTGSFHPLVVVENDVEILLYGDWQYSHQPLWTTRCYGRGNLSCTTLQDFSQPMLQQVCHRLLRKWQGTAPRQEQSFGVGILGYAPSVGQAHGLAIEHVSGLDLNAVCDLSEQRLHQAVADFPSLTLHDNAEAMADDDSVDLVIVATAPNIHATLSIAMMEAGKHVLCEKPLALSSRETDAMQEAAAKNAVHLSCHQNRRWDPDFRLIQNIVKEGRIGEVFYLETFVGGYNHPCGYWHSDKDVSGGTTFDWGAHYLDWVVGLIPFPVGKVMGTRHKRVWHDVSNADQERIQIQFEGGCEAEFLHSDIAAVHKPKWYILGTHGAILGQWQSITAYAADPVHYFRHTEIPATEMMPEISVHSLRNSGEIEIIQPQLPQRDPFAFHRNLADHLLWGEPLAAPLADSVKVVALLEAAACSMSKNSRWEVLNAG